MQKLLITLFFCLRLASSAYADSFELSKIYAKAESITELNKRVKFLNDTAWNVFNDFPEKGLAIAQKAYELTNNTNLLSERASCARTIGLIYYKVGDFSKASTYLMECLKLFEQLGDKKATSKSLNNLGLIFNSMKNYDKALEYFNRSLQLKINLRDTNGMAASYSNIGMVYQNQKKLDKALEFFEKATQIRLKMNDDEALALSYYNLGTTYFDLGNYEKSMNYQLQTKALREKINDKDGLCFVYQELGSLYEKQGNYTEAILYFNKSIKLSQELLNRDNIRVGYKSLSLLYAKTKDFKQAYTYARMTEELSDSIYNQNMTDAITEMDTKYGTQKKEQEIIILNQDKSLKEKEILHQKNTRNWLIGFAILCLFIGVFILNAYKNKQKANILLNQQKLEITHQKQEITDSINYARRIQQAMLPPVQQLSERFPQSFVYFQPRDIVSGDFYYFMSKQEANEQNESYFIAAADCTGHGVPGGFMSMIGMEKLKDAVTQFSNPADILVELNSAVKHSLRQHENSENRDGMDIALVRIRENGSNFSLSFAGANRPIWILRKNNDFEEIKGNKFSIGGHTKDKAAFLEHQIILEKGDTFYLFSDGYADQFGGPEHKKMLSKNFKSFVISLQNLGMTEQGEAIKKHLNNWKGKLKQMDDILVIGVKL